MKRREALAVSGSVVASTLAGCTGGRDGRGTTGVRIVDVAADPPPDLPVAPDVSVADAEETTERPAGIAVEWVNEADEIVRIGEERSIGFRTAKSEDGSAHLLVGDGRDWDDTVSFDGCWYVSGAVNSDGSYRTVRLEPGEALESESGLYADDDGCLGGTYRFRTLVTVEPPGGTAGHGVTEEWGFGLDVERDG